MKNLLIWTGTAVCLLSSCQPQPFTGTASSWAPLFYTVMIISLLLLWERVLRKPFYELVLLFFKEKKKEKKPGLDTLDVMLKYEKSLLSFIRLALRKNTAQLLKELNGKKFEIKDLQLQYRPFAENKKLEDKLVQQAEKGIQSAAETYQKLQKVLNEVHAAHASGISTPT